MRRRGAIFSNIDPVMVILYFVLVLFGWINIYAATYTPEHSSIFAVAHPRKDAVVKRDVEPTQCLLQVPWRQFGSSTSGGYGFNQSPIFPKRFTNQRDLVLRASSA